MLELFYGLTALVALIFIFTFHNFFKAWLATKLGDDTPARAGFLTLNPVPHTDLVGTIILPLVFILMKSPIVLGWPRMVPINFYGLKNPTRAAITVSLSSIGFYFLISILAVVLYKFLTLFHLPDNVFTPLGLVLYQVALISAFFGVLNLIPVPPMDMGYIVFLFLGKSLEDVYRFSLIGSIIVILLFLSGILNYFFTPIWNLIKAIFV